MLINISNEFHCLVMAGGQFKTLNKMFILLLKFYNLIWCKSQNSHFYI